MHVCFINWGNFESLIVDMKKVWLVIVVISMGLLELGAQGTVRMQVIEKDFGIWAYQQHNSICKLVYDKMEAKQLASYNAKNLKENPAESFNKLKEEVIVFINTNVDDPTIGIDSPVMIPKSENYFFFKQSGEYLLLKPFRAQTNLLKFKKSEFMGLLNAEQKMYVELYTSASMLCLDSIPNVSRKVFTDFDAQLFHYSQKGNSVVYYNDSLKTQMSIDEKIRKSMVEKVVFIPSDPEDKTIGYDSVIVTPYNIRDTNINQAIIATFEVNGVAVKVKAIAAGMASLQGLFQSLLVPYGFVPVSDVQVYTKERWLVLNAVMNYKIVDRLNERSYYYEMYNDYFGY